MKVVFETNNNAEPIAESNHILPFSLSLYLSLSTYLSLPISTYLSLSLSQAPGSAAFPLSPASNAGSVDRGNYHPYPLQPIFVRNQRERERERERDVGRERY